jgi:galactokinase
MKSRNSSFDLHSCDLDSISSSLNDEELNLMKGTVQNRNLLKQSLSELEKDEPNHELIGNLLTEHHLVLRDVLGVSTPKIESMLNASLQAGALGGKINGSGGGGCMFSYAPDHPEKVAEAIVKVGGKAYVVHIDDGTIID